MKSKAYRAFSGPAKAAWLGLLLAGFVTGQACAAEKSVSELLEKGIYSEETKGDVEAAMKLYEQVIAEAKSGQAVAAQAQYRLGVCLHKKKNYAESTAAFEKLIKNYPDQEDLIGQARQYLAGTVALMPAPWSDAEQLTLEIKFPTGFKVGTAIYTVNAAERDGKKIWKIGSRLFAGVHSFSRVEVDADTFKPLHSRWKHSLIGDVDTEYGPNYAELKSIGKDSVKKVELADITYDNEQAIQLMRRLPFENNYKNTFRFLSGLAGSVVPVGIEVGGPEKVTVPAGTFDCYKAQLSINQTFWYSADAHHYLVKFEGGGAIAELSEIRQRKLTDPDTFQDPALGFSVAAPAGWFICRQPVKEEKARTSLAILDPDAIAHCDLNVQTLDNLGPEAKKSLRDWAESETTEGAKFYKNLKVRADSFKESTLAGHPALSLMRDYTDGVDKVNYTILMFGPKTATQFSLNAAVKDFEAFRPKFDAIVASYKISD